MASLAILVVICLFALASCKDEKEYGQNYGVDFGDRFVSQADGTALPDNAPVNEYVLSCEDVEWNYAPLGENTGNNDLGIAHNFLYRGKKRVGSTYSKVVYKQWTNTSYVEQIDQPATQGFLGPLMKCEIGEKIVVHLTNRASIPCTIHPHTELWYNDDSEGALFIDGTPPDEKLDDRLNPGQNWTYVWECREDFGPLPDDENCIIVPYHSHYLEPKEIDAGLVGALLVCKRGTLLNEEGRPRGDVDREIVMYTDNVKESNSPLVKSNADRCKKPDYCQYLLTNKDTSFIESTTIPVINGYQYGNGPDFEVCAGERVALYLFGLNRGINTVSVAGTNLKTYGHSFNAIGIPPGIGKTVMMEHQTVGRWMVRAGNLVTDSHGQFGFLNVLECEGVAPTVTQPSGKVRTFYIAAEEVKESTVPGGIVTRAGRETKERSRREKKYLEAGKRRHGRFVGYTDGCFKKRTVQPEHMTNLGPHVYAEAGDIVKIVLKNRMRRRCASFVPIGFDITKENEGSMYRNKQTSKKLSGKIVKPGRTVTYKFIVPDILLRDESYELGEGCYTTTYQSMGEGYAEDILYQLTGPITVCKQGRLDENGNPKGYSKRFFLQAINNEPNCDGSRLRNPKSFRDSGLSFPTYNGYQFGNVKGMDICLGEKVLITLTAYTCQPDNFQSFVFEGNNVEHDGSTVDGVTVYNGQSTTVVMTADNVGTWKIMSGMTNYQEDGMVAVYNVQNCGNEQWLPPKTLLPGSQTRVYCIAAEKVKWEYVDRKTHPGGSYGASKTRQGIKNLTHLAGNQRSASLYIRSDGRFIGTKYYKAVYRAYTDETFETQKQRSFNDEHLAILGPMMKAQVGDKIKIVFKNKLSWPVTISLRNLIGDNEMIRKQSEEGVAPGETATYEYYVPERSGPTECEPDCVGRSYESTTNPVHDANAGLFGPLIICRRGSIDDNECRTDGFREFAIAPVIYDDNQSPYFDLNKRRYSSKGGKVSDSEFYESNMMRAINGKMFFNTPALNMSVGKNVCWYFLSTGGPRSFHPMKFHGQPLVKNCYCREKRDAVVEVEAGTYRTACFYATHASVWKLDTQEADHKKAGVMASFTITNDQVPYECS